MQENHLVAICKARAALREAIRTFFGGRQFVELDTPAAVVCPGTEIHLRYFASSWQDFRGTSKQLWLRTSPELHMKQALAWGAERIYQLAPCWRNGGELGPWHHPEFTMLEWYEVGRSFAGLIDETIELLHASLAFMSVASPLPPRIRLPKQFTRLSVAEAFAEFAGLPLIDEDPELAGRARQAGLVSLSRDDDFETAFFKVLIERVEPALSRLGAVVLYDYPASQAALARVEGSLAKRFEIYIDGVELCNGFHELCDAEENRRRIAATNVRRQDLGYEVPEPDEHFYAALDNGIADCAGNALGFDRWLALLLGATSLDAVLPFRRQPPYSDESFPGSRLGTLKDPLS